MYIEKLIFTGIATTTLIDKERSTMNEPLQWRFEIHYYTLSRTILSYSWQWFLAMGRWSLLMAM
jgi:hypothetical protein